MAARTCPYCQGTYDGEVCEGCFEGISKHQFETDRRRASRRRRISKNRKIKRREHWTVGIRSRIAFLQDRLRTSSVPPTGAREEVRELQQRLRGHANQRSSK